MLLLANLLWGVSFPLVKALAILQTQLAPGSGSWFITASALLPRFSVGALVLGAICWRGVSTLTAREVRQGVGLGVFAVLGMAFQNDGLQFTSASTSAFLTQLYAVMIPAYVALRGRHLPPWSVWVGCGLVLAGVAVLAHVDWHDFRLGRGEVETLICSVFFMIQILWLERKEFAGNRMLPVTVVMFTVQALAAAGLMAVLFRPGANLPVVVTNGAWLGLNGILTLVCTLGTFTIMNVFQPRITATEAGLLYCSEPLFTSLMALFLPALFAAWGGFAYANETLSFHLLVGGGLITLANVIVQLRPPARP